MQKEADCGPSSATDLKESLGPVVAGSVLAEFENTALYALRDFASSGGTAKEVWYGSSGPSSVHPVGLTGGIQRGLSPGEKESLSQSSGTYLSRGSPRCCGQLTCLSCSRPVGVCPLLLLLSAILKAPVVVRRSPSR